MSSFGCFFMLLSTGKVYRDIVGSAYYVAPEVLRRRYEIEVDIWSGGIILYMACPHFGKVIGYSISLSVSCAFPIDCIKQLICKYTETKKGIFDALVEGQPWPSISNSAKDLLPRMLTADLKNADFCCSSS